MNIYYLKKNKEEICRYELFIDSDKSFVYFQFRILDQRWNKLIET